jgi:hypothetical protein
VAAIVQVEPVNDGWTGSFGSDVAAGDSIVLVATGYNGSSGASITFGSPTFGGSPVTGAAELISAAGANDALSIWLLPDVAGGAASFGITVGDSNTGSFVGVIAYDISGLGAAPVLDQSSSDDGSGASDQSSGACGDITGAPEIIIGALVQDSTIGVGYPPAGWTSTGLPGNSSLNSVAGYQIAASPGGSYSYDAGIGAANWAAAVITLKAGAGGVTHSSTAALSISPSLAAAAARTGFGAAALAVTPQLQAAATHTALTGAALTVTPRLRAAAVNTSQLGGGGGDDSDDGRRMKWWW